ncbi:hypothetical protein P691DRAFT_801681 [Macrolepiota fuliginosa MF-IS2]|uniref:DUF3835 domain-containing protein n=1 Tax=Macrolepiota fuliginosa MF-IS2 TaxID=1400762 RepID=A0A9P5XBA9_9AGAR|nr:hypothetical protein P691DRAFT_801681 [Macrolepiota fuliginosa MF-IS2]
MGKTLMRNMGYSGTGGDSSPKEGQLEVHADSQPDTGSKVRKKTVAFVETGDSISNTSKPEWGDVTAARLRPGQRPTLLQAFRPDSNPVKLSVIERKPVGHALAIPSRPTPFPRTTKDSDDESEPEDNQFHPASDGDESDEILEGLPDSGADDGEVELENEYDLDYAQHQREIALEYYKKRNIIGQDAAKTMMNHTHEEDEHEPTLEVPAPSNQPKPSISRFKANRIASSYGASTRTDQSTVLTKSVIPESTARTVQHTIRSGRIDDDNRLVGGEHESDSENEAEGLQEALELLRKGEVYNLGPDGHYLRNAPQPHPNATMVMTPADTSISSPTTPPSSTAAQRHEQQPQRQLPTLNRPKASKFKADRSQAGRPSISALPTPVSHVQRSSPNFPSSLAETILEKTQPKPPSALEAHSVHTSPSSSSPSPIIIESPFFARPQMNTSAQPLTSTVIESPSFPNQSKGPTKLPAAPSPMIIVDSPSFPPPSQRSRRPEHPPTVIPSQSLAIGAAAAAGRPVATPPPTRTIVASTVQERTAPAPKSDQQDGNQGNGSDSTPKKVSRFKQSRERD